MIMRSNYAWIAVIAVLALAGCAQIDQRSDEPDKKPLVETAFPLNIKSKWEADTGKGTCRRDVKLLLAPYGKNLYTVDNKGHIAVVDQQTGVIQWEQDIKARVSAGPAVAEGKLVVGTSDGKVIAVDVANGKVAWRSSATSEILATPRISDDLVFIHTMDGGLSALSLADGRQIWRFTHNLPPLMLRRSSTPVVAGDAVIAGFANGKLLAMRKSDGTVLWAQDIARPKGTTDLQRMIDISADPVVQGDKVYAASYQGNIAALTVSNGHLIWERAVPSYAGFVLDRNMIYVSETNGDIVALDVQNGATFWLQTDLQGRRLSKPAIMDKYLVIADEDGYIHWIDKNSGKLAGRFKMNSRGVEATPIVNNNIVYILGCNGKLVALEVC
jgi:outer membrane protein assembly factor BamB